MKKYILPFAIVIAMVSMVSCAPAYVVRERPHEVVYFRPPAPSPAHIWVSGDWIWTGGRYQWREGYWERPRRGAYWMEGHWQGSRGSYRWAPGHWQRH